MTLSRPRLSAPLRPPAPEDPSPTARARPKRAEVVGALLGAAFALGLCAYAAAGFADAPWQAVAAAALAIAACSCAPLARGRLPERGRRAAGAARPFAVALAVPAGFYLLERPWNDGLFAMDPYYAAANLCVLALLFAVVYFAGQRSRASVAAFLAACLAAGVANHFVIAFKGQPIVPADLFALSTAASVGSGYTFALDARLLEALAAFAACCAVLAFLPKVPATPRRVAANAVCALAVAGCFGWWMGSYDIEEAYACPVDVWGVKESYAERGSALCFLKRVQDLSPAEPDGYAAAAADELLARHADAVLEDGADRPSAPTVIAVMNETFADLSRYPGLADTDARPAYYHDIAASALEAGDAYVSALGGGTCNSEFEFLTGSSMGYLGGGVYPYVLYDLDGSESLVSYFSSLGYATHAVHPAESANWRRDRVYGQLGFDDFADGRAFSEADTLRGLATDRATYDHVLDLLAADEGPQFVFDVTIQNHGGYDVGGIAEEDAVSVPLADGLASSELDEYASCIRQADRDLAYLVERLDALERPVVLCFFGDHQPGFSDWLFEVTYGAQADEMGLDAVQERYTVPYLIWANEAARENGAQAPERGGESMGARSSLNYLGAKVVEAAGLPTTSYQRFLLAASESVPAVNLNGYLAADGVWRWFGEEGDGEAVDTLRSYAIVQYDNLFNKEARSAFWGRAAGA
ncbi:LTA synthase family protein [Gordonibacter massiliensis (ex Traore et al. 2017)]|uniref:LTA synthase family protein n=1 Tax=Gordonibacter massiliensis (ex Traore et al. 2017) TaxID=1841863 RepID=UPI001C8B926D|nr:LTA synthase family protein [Gordonibacter massiliensis (ex Traore et al. 2017)]MBX9034269.1 LTA synthase family protein [Gordonibacter massiliensis (ex Traore et al. 2017)]